MFHLLFCLIVFIVSNISEGSFSPAEGAYVEGDVLYWKASEQGLSYAVKTGDGDFSVKTRLKEPDFEWDFGFKLGLGYRFARDNWDILLRLTHFNTHADSLPHASKDSVLYPIWIAPQERTPAVADAIKMHWRLHLAFIDSLFGKQFSPYPRLCIYPQIGLKFAMARQKFHLEYSGEMQESVRMKNKFQGIGPCGSLGIRWPFLSHFSLAALGELSVLWGRFYIHEDESRVPANVRVAGVRDAFLRFVPIAEGSLALIWQKLWQKSQRSLALHVAWDVVLLFRQKQLKRFSNQQILETPSNLEMRGWEWGARFDF
ncbi:MAG TPA: Lpg1974 family pore-forming outer membrane protein [Rhabdochlamydiaceae bacterium]|jgi:hypothetical protein